MSNTISKCDSEEDEIESSSQELLENKLLSIFNSIKYNPYQIGLAPDNMLREAYWLNHQVVEGNLDDKAFHELYETTKQKLGTYQAATISMGMLYVILSCKSIKTLQTKALLNKLNDRFKLRPWMTPVKELISNYNKSMNGINHIKMNQEKDNGGFTIIVNSPGNFIAKDINFTGPVNIGGGNPDLGHYTDEQIAEAITAINGIGKPLNSKRKWAAVHWGLRWYCNFPTGTKEFCDRVDELPLGKLEFECDYTSIRHFTTFSFMDQDARFLDKVKASKQDNDFFLQCREVVIALATELGKAALPKMKL